MTANDLEDRLERLRAEWPAGSIVGPVMERIGRPRRRWRRAAVGLAAAGLLAASVVTLLSLVGHTNLVRAAIQDGLARARSAHIMLTAGEGDPANVAEIWYLSGRGFRIEMPDEVTLDDGRTSRSWRRGGEEEPVVVVRNSTGAAARIAELLDIPGAVERWARKRAAELDRVIDGAPCRAEVLVPPPGGPPEPGVPEGARPADGRPMRLVLLTDAGRKVRALLAQRRVDGEWATDRSIRINYDVWVDAARLAAGPPAGSRTIDADAAFDGRHPLDRALVRKELGGLMLAIHEVRPLDQYRGYYAVSSVRGTPEFLRKYPPRRRYKNMTESVLDVADQSLPGDPSQAYHRFVLARAQREGVQYTWWLILPKYAPEIPDDVRASLKASYGAPPSEPLRLEVAPGKVRLPLEAYYLDARLRDERGAWGKVLEWVDVDLPATSPKIGVEGAAARIRGDVRFMRYGADANLFGMAYDGPPSGLKVGAAPRPLMPFDPDHITAADYAKAVRKYLDEMLNWDAAPPARGLPAR